MLDSLMLVDQNMVCRSNTDQRDHSRCIPLFRDTSDMYPYFPFDTPTRSDTYMYTIIFLCLFKKIM